MGDQSEIMELRQRLTKLEDAYKKHKKQRKVLIALLVKAFKGLAIFYKEQTGGDELPNLPKH